MRRAAAVGLVAVLAGSAGAAATAGNRIAASTAGYTSVRVTGATMRSISYSTTAGTITAFTVSLKGPPVLLGVTLIGTVRAHFGTAPDVVCAVGLYDAATDTTPATCSPFTQAASRSWSLRITVT